MNEILNHAISLLYNFVKFKQFLKFKKYLPLNQFLFALCSVYCYRCYKSEKFLIFQQIFQQYINKL